MAAKSKTRIWEMGIGRGTREAFPFPDHRTVEEVWNCRFPKYHRAKKAVRPKKQKARPTQTTVSFTATSFA